MTENRFAILMRSRNQLFVVAIALVGVGAPVPAYAAPILLPAPQEQAGAATPPCRRR